MFRRVIGCLACAWSLAAQPTKSYLIDTVAGNLPDDEGAPAPLAVLTPRALALGYEGSIYVVDGVKGVRRITPDDSISRVRGASGANAEGIAVDPTGVLLYIGGPELYRYDPGAASVSVSRPAFGPASGHI